MPKDNRRRGGGRRNEPPRQGGGGAGQGQRGGRGGRGGQGRRSPYPGWMLQDPMERVGREYEGIEQQARRQLEQDTARTYGTYGALQRELAPMAGQYDAEATRIASELQGQLGGLSGLIGQPVPPGELGAAQGAFGAAGAGALGMLAGDRSRNLGYAQSAQRQAALEPEVMARRMQEGMRGELADLRSQMPGRLDELADTRLQQMLARREMAMRQQQLRTEGRSSDAMRQFLLAQIGQQLNRGPGGGRGGGRGRRRGGGR
jgi:hypothetical protein